MARGRGPKCGPPNGRTLEITLDADGAPTALWVVFYDAVGDCYNFGDHSDGLTFGLAAAAEYGRTVASRQGRLFG